MGCCKVSRKTVHAQILNSGEKSHLDSQCGEDMLLAQQSQRTGHLPEFGIVMPPAQGDEDALDIAFPEDPKLNQNLAQLSLTTHKTNAAHSFKQQQLRPKPNPFAGSRQL
jgi:hypothetical protein